MSLSLCTNSPIFIITSSLKISVFLKNITPNVLDVKVLIY